MIFWIFLALLPLVLVLKARASEPRLSPDAHIYIALASGVPGPAPYCYRILSPLLARIWARLSGRQPRETLADLGRLGALGSVVATYALTWTLSGSHGRALVSAYAITFADPIIASSFRTPWLIDAFSSALALASAALALGGHPIPAVVLLCATALSKEAWAVLSGAFIIGAAPGLWWTILPALGIHAVVRLVVRPALPDPQRAPWLIHPLGWAWAHKKHKWFDWRTNIGRLGPSPWLMAYYADRSPLTLAVVAVVLLSWAQAHVAADHDRLLAHMLPFVIPSLCITAPTEVLMVYLAASCYWPFYRDG